MQNSKDLLEQQKTEVLLQMVELYRKVDIQTVWLTYKSYGKQTTEHKACEIVLDLVFEKSQKGSLENMM